MSLTLQVVYPATEGTKFDFNYYMHTHLPMLSEKMGAHIEQTLVTRGLSGAGDAPMPYHAVATMVFADQVAMEAALGNSSEVLGDIPNFTDTQPQFLVGEVVG